MARKDVLIARLRAYLLLAVLLTVQFWPLLRSNTFGPEFTQFFMFVDGKSLGQVLKFYGQLHTPWYRPSQFFLPFWAGQQFVDWHNIVGWRLLEFATFLAVVYLVYELVRLLLPDRPFAAFAAALYYGFNPTTYVPVFELFAFDFVHIIFVLLCAILFIRGLRNDGSRSLIWLALSGICFAVALTSKEIALVTPMFLVLASAILQGRDALPRVSRWMIPFAVLCGLYWWLHIRQIPPDAFGSTGDYRLGFNWEVMADNAIKYVLWMTRLFGPAPDSLGQAAGYLTPVNDLIGIGILAMVALGTSLACRKDGRARRFALLMAVWVGVFLTIPVYSGGYFWHGNLALCGFAGIAGLAADAWWRRLGSWRVAAASLAIAGMVVVGYKDAYACITRGIHSEAFRINQSVLSSPPAPPQTVGKGALVYVEDRKRLGWWFYGAGSLFNLVYRDTKLKQVLVSKLEDVDAARSREWLEHPNAFCFRYDQSYRWSDASSEFRAFAKMKAESVVLAPEIFALSPNETRQNQRFQVQPDGTSALGVTGNFFQHGAVVLLDGKKLPTAYGHSKWISAQFPNNLLEKRGKLTITVRNPDGQVSNPSTFTVR